MRTINKDWHPARYVCVFLLGVVCALVSTVRAHDPDTTGVMREHTQAIRELTSAIKNMPKCPK